MLRVMPEAKEDQRFRREVLKTAAIAVLAQALFSVVLILGAGNDRDRLVTRWAMEAKCRPCMVEK